MADHSAPIDPVPAMQYRIRHQGPNPDLATLAGAIADLDPAAMLDFARDAQWLRVASILDEAELAATLTRAGYPVRADDVLRQPSECCGGCGG